VASGTFVDAARLDNTGNSVPDLAPAARVPCVASIYQLDGLVRRAPALQRTADGRDGKVTGGEVAA
jgi:NADH-quinone oxidoreductase subunit G